MNVPKTVVGSEHAESRTPGAPVLIVEDDVIIRTALRSALEGEGIEVADVADGQAAVDYVARQRPALILLDMGLPVLDGVAVGLRVRSLYDQSLPIIVLSADSRLVEKARHVGAVGYLQKPFDMGELLDTVLHALAAADENAADQ